MYECTSVNGEFEGEDGDLVQLQNGMIFKLTSYAYNYGYSPEVAVFARQFNYAGRDLIFYKLLVEDEVYDAERLK